MLAIVLMVLQFALIRTDANIIDLTLSLQRKVVLGIVSAALSWRSAGSCSSRSTGASEDWSGFIAGRVVLSVSYPLMVGRLLGISPARQAAGAVRPAIATGLLFTGCAMLAGAVHAGTWVTLVMWSTSTAVAIALFAFFAGLSAATRRRLWVRLRKVVDSRERRAHGLGAGGDLHGQHGRWRRRARDGEARGGMAGRGYDVDLVLSKAEGHYLPEISGDVRVVDLGAGRVLASLPGARPASAASVPRPC